MTCNGWTNSDTWLVNVWLSNDEYWNDKLEKCINEDDIESLLIDALQDGYITDDIDISEVNFAELLEHVLEE